MRPQTAEIMVDDITRHSHQNLLSTVMVTLLRDEFLGTKVARVSMQIQFFKKIEE